MRQVLLFLFVALLAGASQGTLAQSTPRWDVPAVKSRSLCDLVPALCQADAPPPSCPLGQYWTLAGSGIPHCVEDDPACAWGMSVAHDQSGNPSCVPNTCPVGQFLQDDGITCGAGIPPPPTACTPPAQLQPDGSCETTCPAGQFWNGQACMAFPPPSCQANSVWDGAACVCPAPTTDWNGVQCVNPGGEVPPPEPPPCVAPNIRLPNGSCGPEVPVTPPPPPPLCPGNSVSDGVNCNCPQSNMVWDPPSQLCIVPPPSVPVPPHCVDPQVELPDGSCAVRVPVCVAPQVVLPNWTCGTPLPVCIPPMVTTSDGTCVAPPAVCKPPEVLLANGLCGVPPVVCAGPAVLKPDGTCGLPPATCVPPATLQPNGSCAVPVATCVLPEVMHSDGTCALPTSPICMAPLVLKSDGSCNCADGQFWNGASCVSIPSACPQGLVFRPSTGECLPPVVNPPQECTVANFRSFSWKNPPGTKCQCPIDMPHWYPPTVGGVDEEGRPAFLTEGICGSR